MKLRILQANGEQSLQFQTGEGMPWQEVPVVDAAEVLAAEAEQAKLQAVATRFSIPPNRVSEILLAYAEQHDAAAG